MPENPTSKVLMKCSALKFSSDKKILVCYQKQLSKKGVRNALQVYISRLVGRLGEKYNAKAHVANWNL